MNLPSHSASFVIVSVKTRYHGQDKLQFDKFAGGDYKAIATDRLKWKGSPTI